MKENCEAKKSWWWLHGHNYIEIEVAQIYTHLFVCTKMWWLHASSMCMFQVNAKLLLKVIKFIQSASNRKPTPIHSHVMLSKYGQSWWKFSVTLDGIIMWIKVGWEWGKDCHVVLLHIVMYFVHSSESEIANYQSLWQFLFYSV